MWFVAAGAAAALLAFGVASALTGGFEIALAGLRVSVRDPWQPIGIGGALAVIAMVLARRTRGSADQRRIALVAFCGCALILILVLTTRGAFVAAGADASGYVSQAALWERGRLHVVEPLVAQVEWPDKRYTFAPLGYRPSPDGVSQVPTYAPGLPMLMALARIVGGEPGGYAVVPLMGLLTLAVVAWAAYETAGAWASVVAGLLLTLSPTFLHQIVQPMSDVPAACLWTLAMWGAWRARSPGGAAAAGLAAAAAIVVRPNLLPLAGLVVWLVATGESARAQRLARAVASILAAGVGALAVATIQWRLYGSPLESGYGDLSVLFAVTHLPANLARYPVWLVGAEPFLVAGLLAPFIRSSTNGSRRLAAAGVATFALTFATYAFYLPFDNWTYLRFLQPAFPLLAVGASVVLARVAARTLVAGSVLSIAIAASGVVICRSHDALGPKRVTARFVSAAQYVNEMLPADAVLVCHEHSGALRYYTGRTILRFDYLRPEFLDDAVAQLRGLGRPVYFVLDDFEVRAVRQRFGAASKAGRLDSIPVHVLQTGDRVYVFEALP